MTHHQAASVAGATTGPSFRGRKFGVSVLPMFANPTLPGSGTADVRKFTSSEASTLRSSEVPHCARGEVSK
jgi:hypothetical protein